MKLNDIYTFVDKNAKKRLKWLSEMELIGYKEVGRSTEVHLTTKGTIMAKLLIEITSLLKTRDKDLKETELRIPSR